MTSLDQSVVDASVSYFNSNTKANHDRWSHAVKCLVRGIDEPYTNPKSAIHIQLEKELRGK